MNNEMKLYDPWVVSRGRPKHISKLGGGSAKKISIKCPNCGKVFERYMRVLAASGNFECQQCTLQRTSSCVKPDIGSTFNRLTLVEYTSDVKYGLFDCSCGTKGKKVLYSTPIPDYAKA